MSTAKEKGKPSIVAKVARSFRDMRGEMKRVVWPTRKQTINNTVVVIGFMLVMGLVIGGFDTGLSALIKLFFGA